jgi:hypothetical protein
VSGARCSLQGYPTIALSAGRGTQLHFTYRRGGDQTLTSAPPTRIWLRPGADAYLGINKETCTARQTVVADRIRVTPPGDHQSTAARLPAYPMLGYCGAGDPGHVIDITPAEPSIQAVLASHEWKPSERYRVTAPTLSSSTVSPTFASPASAKASSSVVHDRAAESGYPEGQGRGTGAGRGAAREASTWRRTSG